MVFGALRPRLQIPSSRNCNVARDTPGSSMRLAAATAVSSNFGQLRLIYKADLERVLFRGLLALFTRVER